MATKHCRVVPEECFFAEAVEELSAPTTLPRPFWASLPPDYDVLPPPSMDIRVTDELAGIDLSQF